MNRCADYGVNVCICLQSICKTAAVERSTKSVEKKRKFLSTRQNTIRSENVLVSKTFQFYNYTTIDDYYYCFDSCKWQKDILSVSPSYRAPNGTYIRSKIYTKHNTNYLIFYKISNARLLASLSTINHTAKYALFFLYCSLVLNCYFQMNQIARAFLFM